MTKDEFLLYVGTAADKGWGIRVHINMPDLPKHEIICNPPENVHAKQAYYDEAYDDQMQLKAFKQIRIEQVDFLKPKEEVNG